MAMKKGTKQILLIGGLGVGGYFAYTWWQGRQAAEAEAAGFWPGGYGAGAGAGMGGGFGSILWGGGGPPCGPMNEGVPEEEIPSVPVDLSVPPGVTPSDWWSYAYDQALREAEAGGGRGDTDRRARSLWDRIRIGAVTRETARAQARESAVGVTAHTQAQLAAYRSWKAVEARTPRGTAYIAGLQPYRGLTSYPATPISTPSMDVIRQAAAKSRLDFQMKRGLGGGAASLPIGESLAAKRAAGAITRATASAVARQRAVAVTTLAQARVAEYQAAAATVKPTAYTVGRQPYVGLTGYPRTPTVSPVVTQQIKEQRLAAAMHNI